MWFDAHVKWKLKGKKTTQMTKLLWKIVACTLVCAQRGAKDLFKNQPDKWLWTASRPFHTNHLTFIYSNLWTQFCFFQIEFILLHFCMYAPNVQLKHTFHRHRDLHQNITPTKLCIAPLTTSYSKQSVIKSAEIGSANAIYGATSKPSYTISPK